MCGLSAYACCFQVLALPPPRLLPRITPLLMCDNEEAVTEAARVYGNYSRSPDVRDYMQVGCMVGGALRGLQSDRCCGLGLGLPCGVP